MLLRSCGQSVCTARVDSELARAPFARMCCTNALKTSTAASSTPIPLARSCGTPPISCIHVACVRDCGCVAIAHCDLSLLENQVLGLVKVFPNRTVVFTTRTFFKYRFQHTGIHGVGHVECGCPLVHPNVCLVGIRDVILDVPHNIVNVVVPVLWTSLQSSGRTLN